MASMSTPSSSIMTRSESKPSHIHRLESSEEYRELHCSLCDMDFKSKALLRDHMESSDRHPQCDLCGKSFLNMNSLRRHLILSNRHHHCTTCEKSFDTPLALRIHLEHTKYHREERDELEEDKTYAYEKAHYPDNWENIVAADITRRENIENEVVVDDEDQLSRIDAMKKILDLKQRMAERKPRASSTTTRTKSLKQTCAICLCVPKQMCVTKCGHMFCSPCINQAFEQGQGCPTCRKVGFASQLRDVDLFCVC
ncbi:hypothetical protein D9757_014449 [Collybiopsis confluens]|uniref:RING-type domain-containing protein n=1 Tax=Collybiopsis confluens TaxID=2823264 RepID=A0A8H5CYK7_9AGAR|nr:hypothetical protein D9757_014449 [Collybiopsis confluens]